MKTYEQQLIEAIELIRADYMKMVEPYIKRLTELRSRELRSIYLLPEERIIMMPDSPEEEKTQ